MTRLFFILFTGLTLLGYSQEKYTLSGTIFEAEGQETLIGANILILDLNTGTISNEYGFYSITLNKGTYEITVSTIGYTSLKQTIVLDRNISQNFTLTESLEILGEVVINTDIERIDIKTPQMSVNSLTASTIKQIPVVFGEADVIKAITLLPGVSSGGEGAAGFNVRGGAVDQNLILLDEATIFNSSHLFGLFSVFNPDAIKNLKLYKGGIPAKYGGRVASVLDIYQKEGNKNKFQANGGVGIVASRLLLEGPIKKGTGSFLFGGRATYAHLLLPLFDVDNIAYFYDLNTKISYKLNQKNNIYLSGYFGRDVFSISNSFENTYGNTVVNFRWNHLFSDQLFSNLSLIYSDYYYGLDLNFVGFEWNSGIQNMNINDRYKLEYGIHSTYYRFNPGVISPNGPDSGINREALTNKFAFENAFYIDVNQQLTERLALSYGARLSSFLRLGQYELNVYENDKAVEYNSDLQIYEKIDPIGTESSSQGKVIKSFLNFEPRLALSYQLNEDTSLKASYNRMTQYLHLLSNTSSPAPLDVWTPSGKFIQPQILDQLAVGYFKNYEAYSLEVESFYKTIKNRIDYIDGANLIANNAIEQVLLNGRSRAYGLELLVRKNKGRFKGWFAYTLSKSEQQTEGLSASDPGINNGNWYNTPYDKTHDISITSTYDLTEKWKLSANFLFQTGQPTTYPNGQYNYNGLVIPTFEARNSSRLDAYHRFDISGTYTPKPNKQKGWQSEWVFSIYNLYNRKNTQSLNFRENEVTGQNEAVKLSLFGVVGALSYNFKF